MILFYLILRWRRRSGAAGTGGVGRRPVSAAATGLGVRDEPLQSDVDVVFLLAGNGVAADLAVLNGVQVHPLDKPVLV